ncbi:MAG: prenyltransferase, partial [Bacteroidota bacterium]
VGSSLLIAGVYPLTQVYQHEADAAAGDRTMSLLLGYRGTFVFSMLMFAVAGFFIYLELARPGQMRDFFVFLGFLAPVIMYFNWWMMQVWKSTTAANFKNTMRMNALASTCMNLAFFTITILHWAG